MTTGDKTPPLLSDSIHLPPGSPSSTSPDVAASESDEEWRGSEISCGNNETDGAGEGSQTASSEQPENKRCIICEKTFRHKGHLLKHVRAHSDSPEHLCGVCGERLKSTKGLSDHLKSHRDNLSTRGTCKICGKTFQNIETHKRSHTGVKPFTCDVCRKSFPREGALRRHKKIHSRKNLEACQICGQMFTEKHLLQEHVKMHEDENGDQSEGFDIVEDKTKQMANTPSTLGEKSSFCCKVCGDFFYSRGFLGKHAKTHCNDSKNTCGICGEQLDTSGSLQTHLQSHKESSGKCNVCGKRFQNVETHMRSHTGYKPYRCAVCRKRFPRPGALRQHERTHRKSFTESSTLRARVRSDSMGICDGNNVDSPSDGSKLEPEPQNVRTPSSSCCKVCGETFQTKASLLKHVTSHSSESVCGICGGNLLLLSETLTEHLQTHKETSSVCHVCGKKYQNIETHMRSHTGFKPYRCSICGKSFPRPGALRRHRKTHSGERPFICEICGKTYTDGCSLTTHLKKNHTGDKPVNRVSCETCGKSLASAYILEVHKRIHTGEKPFLCRICGNTFRQLAGLNAHMLTHTGEKPFSCSLCSKSFSTKGYLQTHIRFHKKERAFSCHLCRKAFVTNTDLKKHLLTHSGEKPYSCQICGKSYQEKRSREVHMKVHQVARSNKIDR